MVFCVSQALTSLAGQMVRKLPTIRETSVQSLGWEDSPGERHGNSLQYYCLENSIDRGAWQATVHGVTKELDMIKRLAHRGV